MINGLVCSSLFNVGNCVLIVDHNVLVGLVCGESHSHYEKLVQCCILIGWFLVIFEKFGDFGAPYWVEGVVSSNLKNWCCLIPRGHGGGLYLPHLEIASPGTTVCVSGIMSRMLSPISS